MMKINMKYKILIIIIIVLDVNTIKLPDYIHICKRSDPNLNECALESGRFAIPEVLKGAPKFHIPPLNPLLVPKINIQAGSNLNIEMTDCVVRGLENVNLTSVNMNLEKQHVEFKVTISRANMIGKYKMNGRILILPIRGEGDANITFTNGDFTYDMDYKLEPRNKKEYIQIANHSISFTTKRIYYHFDNLFEGNKQLGDNMNKFLDENWADVTKELGSTVGETISTIITSIAMSIFSKIPADEVLPP